MPAAGASRHGDRRAPVRGAPPLCARRGNHSSRCMRGPPGGGPTLRKDWIQGTMNTPTLLALGALALLAAPAPLTAQKPDSTPHAAAPQAKPGQKPDSGKKKLEVKPKIDFARLKFMEGCWRGKIDKDTDVEEIWTDRKSVV